LPSVADIELTTLSIRRTPISVADDLPEAQFVVLLGPAVGQTLPLGDGVLLGRATAGLAIDDDGVSRRHAEVTRRPDGSYQIRDLGSRNGTYVNGVRITEAELSIGDRVAIGGQTVLQLGIRDRLEDQRIAAQKLQALGELAGGIAHDFNNLLGAVLANVSHLQGQASLDPEEMRRVLADIEAAARRAGDLTHDLLAFARSGPRGREPVEVAAIVDDAVRLLRRALPRNIELVVAVEPDLVVRGDAGRLAQIVTHIGLNAVAAMPSGGRLEISAVRRTEPPVELGDEQLMLPADEFVDLTIRDTGVGMDPDVRRRAFEPFFTTKPRGTGTGLGLATAMAIARDHGGHITLSSVPSVGTVAHVFLPLRGGRPAGAHHTVDDASPLTGCVLVADDEDLVRDAARRVLERAGLKVLMAIDGAEAVEVFSKYPGAIDLVLLDLDMPRMDGEQALAAMRAMDPSLRVLISSGYVERSREANLRAAGIDGTLDKPYDAVTLLRAVATALRSGQRKQP
jgi:signal transduction histidine kinase/CheY-like chemotaxis protein